MLRCPMCGKEVKTERGMKKHLMGTRPYGGHEFSAAEAVAAINRMLYPTDSAKKPTPMPQKPSPRAAEPREFLPEGDFLRDLLASMAANKVLPKYQFERRVDAMLALFLPGIFQELYGWNAEVVVPEFPIKKANNNQTTNVDYLLFRKGEAGHPAAWIFFELKTDSGSYSGSQLAIYQRARERGMAALRDDLNRVLAATQAKAKYRELLRRIDRYPVDTPIEIVYLLPGKPPARETEKVHLIGFQDLEGVELSAYSDAWKLFKQEILPLFRGRGR